MKLSTFLILAVLYLSSPAESNKCYQCGPCVGELKDSEVFDCPDVVKACGKFVIKTGEVFRGCITEQFKEKYDGKCDIKLSDLHLGFEGNSTGCIYGCIGDKCNSAPSAFGGQWKMLMITLLAFVLFALL